MQTFSLAVSVLYGCIKLGSQGLRRKKKGESKKIGGRQVLRLTLRPNPRIGVSSGWRAGGLAGWRAVPKLLIGDRGTYLLYAYPLLAL